MKEKDKIEIIFVQLNLILNETNIKTVKKKKPI